MRVIKLESVPDGYCIVHSPRSTSTNHSRGGGLCLSHRDSIQVKQVRDISHSSFGCLLVKLVLSRSNSSDVISFAVAYRPPTTPAASSVAAFYDELSGLFDKLADAIDGDRLVCCGDFNCGGDDATSVSSDMHAVFDAHGLQQFVQSPTRRTHGCSSLLDLVIC